MSKKKHQSDDLFIEFMVPTILYVWIAPFFMNEVWLNVMADTTTPWYVYAVLYSLAIGIGISWTMFYNCVRIGLFPPKRRR
jgi:uncharacterized membrane-anchored protein YitT (DUF2179 family)